MGSYCGARLRTGLLSNKGSCLMGRDGSAMAFGWWKQCR